jgi:hypothetical protein
VWGQLVRLTRAVAGAGPTTHAIGVCAEGLDSARRMPDVSRPARERGFEGVAWADDAARAPVLYCALRCLA